MTKVLYRYFIKLTKVRILLIDEYQSLTHIQFVLYGYYNSLSRHVLCSANVCECESLTGDQPCAVW